MSSWNDPLSAAPSRFRIRVGNEQIDLPTGGSLIGREATCRIAILDSTISRRHARIQCDGEWVTIEDLGSSNGTRVNGILISGPHVLREGDRIGVGSCELVMGVVDAELADLRDSPTGQLGVCNNCRSCYAAQLRNCPNCGAARGEKAAASRRIDETAEGRWSLGLLLEMLGKAMLAEREIDAERIMREVALVVADRLHEGRAIDPEELTAVVEATRWLTRVQKSDDWSNWLVSVQGQLRRTLNPPPAP
ncbi:MAG: FHA domain-containing protein [Myxococcales bacterium]